MSEWTVVVSKNNKQSKKSKSTRNHTKMYIQPATYKSTSTTIKPKFDFQEDIKTNTQEKQSTKSISVNHFPELKKKQEKKNKPRFEYEEDKSVDQSRQKTWSSIICKKQENPPKIECAISIKKVETTEIKKPNQFTIYLYNREVNKLLGEMKWGDFECMMDDVIIIPDDQPKPNTK